VGSYFAIGFFAMGGFGGFGLIAPVLNAIAADIGDPTNPSQVNWLALVYALCLAVGGTLVGRFTDIFGRRYFFLVGAALGVVGDIICATAKNIPVAIGGQTLNRIIILDFFCLSICHCGACSKYVCSRPQSVHWDIRILRWGIC
jgi:MFS family permease